MAGSIYVPLKTVYDDSGIRKAQKSVGSLAKSFKSALGGLGVGLGIGAVTAQLEQAAKQAALDAKSYAVLANTIKNVTGATDGAIKSSDSWLSKLSMQVGIADDALRPALGRLVTATGDLTKAQSLLSLATDLAASKNIDVTTAANALAKAVGGQTTALFRLAPELKKSSDWMATLKANTAGAAETAANADPFQRLTVIFGEMQESIGYALLPAMQDIAKFLASEEFQGVFKQVAEDFKNIVTGLQVVAGAVEDLVTGINDALDNIGIDFDIMKVLNKFFPFISGLQTIINYLKQLGLIKNQTDKLYAGSGVNTTTLAGILAASKTGTTTDSPYNPKSPTSPKKLTVDTTAMTKAVNAAKAAFDAQVKAYQEAVSAAQGVIDSTKEMMSGFTALFAITPKMGEFEQKVVDGFQSIFDTIKSTLADKRILQSSATALTAYANSTLATLKSYAQQQDVLAQKIDIARTITGGVTGLANLTSMLETTTEQVTSVTRSMANGIETIMTKTFDVTKTGGIVDNFKALVDKTKAFATNLISLKKLGLNKNLFAQLVNAGADAGGATAQAIVDGGNDTIVALNDLYKELDLSAASIAETSTQTLYEVGQQIISNGFIEGMVSQADALAAAAKTLAEAFASSFQAQLGAALNLALPAMPVAPATTAIGTRPDPNRSPQRYAAWLAGIGGIDPIRSPQSYAAQQAALNAGPTYNVTVNAGMGTNGTSVAQEIINTVKAYERNNGAVWTAA